MNIFEQYGIKEVADVTLYSIELDENDDEIYVPVLYMDTLKVSTVEESTSQTSAQGGIGNPKLITWDYGKDITVTLEDALFTPASESMNWGGKLGAKGLKLYLSYFFDRNTDNNTPDTCLRTATLIADEFSDFLIIPDRWIDTEIKCGKNPEKHIGYVGQMSIYCWLVNGHIVSDDNKKRVSFEKLLLFYREATQKWYFFNGQGIKDNETNWYKNQFSDEDIKYYPIGYQYGEDTFNWIKENICGDGANYKWRELEEVAKVTWNKDNHNDGVFFLTQNLYIDGYRKGCAKHLKYSNITEQEKKGYQENKYIPYRYFANVGVEYNTNIVPPQDVIYQIDTALNNVVLLENLEKCQATDTFCIDVDINMKHGQYRYLEKYSQTELTVYLDPRTMQPYQSNCSQFYSKKGQRITGNLRLIHCGEHYYKWSRQKAKEHQALGRQIIIDPIHYPGVYRLVGETYKRDRFGQDQKYQFEIPLCKLHPENKLTLQADGDSTVFTMKLTALRRSDGVMMKLTSYDIINKQFNDNISDSTEIVPFTSPNPELDPKPYNGEEIVNSDIDLTLKALTPRDIAPSLIALQENNEEEVEGLFKTFEEPTEENAETRSRVQTMIKGKLEISKYSIDGTIRPEVITQKLDNVSINNIKTTVKGGEYN